MKIDAHQHFWIYDSKRDTWMTDEMAVLRQDFLSNNLFPVLSENDMDACIAVQAAQTEEETKFLLDLAETNPCIQGVVGWVDLRAIDSKERISVLAEYNLLKGFRHIVQSEPAGFMDQSEFRRGISALEDYNLTYDILIYPHQLDEAIRLVRDFPEQKFVIDHLAKPNYEYPIDSAWKEGMNNLSESENVFCKVSGMVTETQNFKWTKSQFLPYLELMMEYFGADRLMFGSDWPVCLLGGDYHEIIEIVKNYTDQLSETEQKSIWGQTAIEFYRLEREKM